MQAGPSFAPTVLALRPLLVPVKRALLSFLSVLDLGLERPER